MREPLGERKKMDVHCTLARVAVVRFTRFIIIKIYDLSMPLLWIQSDTGTAVPDRCVTIELRHRSESMLDILFLATIVSCFLAFRRYKYRNHVFLHLPAYMYISQAT